MRIETTLGLALVAGLCACRHAEGGCAPVACPADVDCDLQVGVDDLIAVITDWGCHGRCAADVTSDDDVDVADLTAVLVAWGDCPAACMTTCTGFSEGEVCGDDTNGGCNDGPLFPMVEVPPQGGSYCGFSWLYGGVRDTDWFRVQVGPSGIVRASMTSELPCQLVFVLDAGGACDASDLEIDAETATDECVEVMLESTQLAPGQLVYVFVAFGTGDGIFGEAPCEDVDGTTENEYRLTIESE